MSAIISDCLFYRYRLERRFAEGPTLMFVMVNPSTADASTWFAGRSSALPPAHQTPAENTGGGKS